MHDRTISRRRFPAATASSLAFTYIPKSVWGANDLLYLVGIGAGEVKDLTKGGGAFVALCDVEAESGGFTDETGPDWPTITYRFAARDSAGGGKIGTAVGPNTAVETFCAARAATVRHCLISARGLSGLPSNSSERTQIFYAA